METINGRHKKRSAIDILKQHDKRYMRHLADSFSNDSTLRSIDNMLCKIANVRMIKSMFINKSTGEMTIKYTHQFWWDYWMKQKEEYINKHYSLLFYEEIGNGNDPH